MSDGFTKLFSSIIHSSVWQESKETKLVWVTMMAMADAEGYVGASIPGVAKAAGVTIAECEAALALFMAPDKYSRNQDNEGRRVVDAPRGWKLLNYGVFREGRDGEDRKEYQRRWAAEKRNGKGGNTSVDSGVDKLSTGVDTSTDVDSCRPNRPLSTNAEAEAEGDLSDPSASSSPLEPQGSGIRDSDARDPWVPEGVVATGTRTDNPVVVVPAPVTLIRDQHRWTMHQAWVYGVARHAACVADGLAGSRPWHGIAVGEAEKLLSARVRDAVAMASPPDYARALGELRNVVDVAEAEARRDGSLRWLTPSGVWNPKSFARAIELTPKQAGAPRAGPAGKSGLAVAAEEYERLLAEAADRNDET